MLFQGLADTLLGLGGYWMEVGIDGPSPMPVCITDYALFDPYYFPTLPHTETSLPEFTDVLSTCVGWRVESGAFMTIATSRPTNSAPP